MSILINTPSGHVGGAVVARLLAAGAPVTVITRHPDRLGDLAARLRVVTGSIDDAAVLEQAFAGSEAVFWVTPSLSHPDFMRWAPRTAELAVGAARQAGVRRAVVLSSVSAQVAAGTGPIASLHGVERAFRAGFDDVVLLRPAFFMENHLASLPTIAGASAMFGPIRGSHRFAQIASADVAERAAALLADRGWKGARVLGLHGPADISHDDVAAAIGAAIGRPVGFVTATPEQARAGMEAAGLPGFVIEAYLEMYASMGNGVFQQAEPRTVATTTPTTIQTFAEQVVRPALAAAGHRAG